MRSLSTVTITSIAAMTLRSIAGHAQTAPSAQCGVETWSTDKMTYVSTPCADGETTVEKAKAGEPAVSGTAAYCAALVKRYDAPKLRPPFNTAARKKAGFTQTELDYLLG